MDNLIMINKIFIKLFSKTSLCTFYFRYQKWLVIGVFEVYFKIYKMYARYFCYFVYFIISLWIVYFVGPCWSLKWDISCKLRIDASNSCAYTRISQYVKETDSFPLLTETAMANILPFCIFNYKHFVRVAHDFGYFMCCRNTVPTLEEDIKCKTQR